ncbi:hypothetical protein IAR55_000691 [Kwoniella newhampshirensis]|uniref:Uncharacterized protein n=1 Tax=Kwoniella newhampshirensis TaxID=1651941 RepID=A0AAW0Z9Y1_9TREE
MTMAAQPSASPFTLPPSSSASSSSAFITPSKKRRAASPPPSPLPFSSSFAPPSSPWATTSAQENETSHREKRRRPNLANGFSSLSISPGSLLGSNANTAKLPDHEDIEGDEGIGLTPTTNRNDLRVEILPEPQQPRSSNHHHHHHSNTHHWSIPNRAGPSSSSSSTSPTESSEGNYDSDATYTRNLSHRTRRYAGVAQQADEVVQPLEKVVPSFGSAAELGVEDVTGAPRGRRRREEDSEYIDRMSKRRRWNGEMDVDMKEGAVNTSASENGDQEIEDISRQGDKRRRGKTMWFEPEKDRIVITALSDSSRSSSRSPSPDSIESQLSQPGSQGFTLSPSLLTHLLKTQRDKFNGPLGDMLKNEKSLILYRPLGIQNGTWTEPVVKTWEGHEDDSRRFEEIAEDENFVDSIPTMDIDADATMNVEGGQTWDGDVDMAMDVE